MCNRAYLLRLNILIVIPLLLPVAPFVRADENSGEVCKPVIYANTREDVIFVRPHETAFLTCTLTQNQLQELIRGFLAGPDHQHRNFKTVFIGRLVDHPWLSKYLAEQALAHAGWDREKGEPAAGDINQYVRDVLSAPDLLGRIQEPFAGSGYTVVGASVEKVLVSRASDIEWLETDDPALVPYDAMVHFILHKP